MQNPTPEARRRDRARGKLWYRLVLSYACMLIVAMMFAWILIFDAMDRVGREYAENGLASANLAAERLDDLVDGMNRTAFLLGRSAVRATFASDANVYNEMQLVRLLAEHNSVIGDQHETFLCWSDRTCVYNADGKYDAYVYWRAILAHAGHEGELAAWNDIKKPAWRTYTDDNGLKRYMYVFPIRVITMSASDKNAFIVIEFTQAQIDGIVRAALGDEYGGAYRLYSGGFLLDANGTGADEGLNAFLSGDAGGLGARSENGDYYFGAYKKATETHVVLRMRNLGMLEIASRYLGNLLRFGVPLLAAGIALALRFTHVNYTPIRRVVRKLGGDGTGDEMEYIIGSIDDMREDGQKSAKLLREQEIALRRQKELLRAQALSRILRGGADAAGDFSRDVPVGVLCARLCGKNILANQQAMERMRAFAAAREMEIVECEDAHALVAVCPGRENAARDAEALAQALEAFAPSVGASACGSIDGLNRAYMEAAYASEEGAREERPWTRFDIRTVNYSSDEAFNRQMMYLKQAVQTSGPMAQRYVREALNAIRTQTPVERKRNRFLLLNLLHQEILSQKMEIPADAMFDAVQTEDFEQYARSVQEIARSLCEQLEKHGEIREQARGEELVRYVREHANEYDLGTEKLQQVFALSEGRVSRALRDATGASTHEFIIRVRMENARELLLGGALSVAEISQRVGYGSVSHFIKLFKRAYGVTPAQFREGGASAPREDA